MSFVEKEGKKKALATWNEDDLSSSDEYQNEVISHSIHLISNITLDDLHDAFNDLITEFKRNEFEK